VNACKDAAIRAGATVPATKTILYLNAAAGPGAAGGYVVADPALNAPTALVHEMSHIYGLNRDSNISVRIDSIDLARSTATLTVTY
jgi:hypothetical protein